MARKAVVSARFVEAVSKQRQEQAEDDEQFMRLMYEQYITEAQSVGFTLDEAREYAIRMVNE